MELRVCSYRLEYLMGVVDVFFLSELFGAKSGTNYQHVYEYWNSF